MTAASALTECFADLPAPRVERTRLHALTDILVIAIYAVLCGAEGRDEIAKFSEAGKRNEIPRLHGDFFWRQFANIKSIGIPSAYVAMFDEFDEGTAIAKAAEDASMAPADQYFLTLDADGVPVSSDFYLRLTGDGARMLQGKPLLQWSCPTPFTSTH